MLAAQLHKCIIQRSAHGFNHLLLVVIKSYHSPVLCFKKKLKHINKRHGKRIAVAENGLKAVMFIAVQRIQKLCGFNINTQKFGSSTGGVRIRQHTPLLNLYACKPECRTYPRKTVNLRNKCLLLCIISDRNEYRYHICFIKRVVDMGFYSVLLRKRNPVRFGIRKCVFAFCRKHDCSRQQKREYNQEHGNFF